MRSVTHIVAAAFVSTVVAGTVLDRRASYRRPSSSILVADLHVHPYPGDGALPVGELRHEARRRGLDVIAITGHNNRFGLELARMRTTEDAPIVLPGQEVTARNFHMVALGVERMIDWRLSAREAIAAIHDQGGVAIAAHPSRGAWRDRDPEALRSLDGAEVAHPSQLQFSNGREQFQEFFDRARSLNPGLAPIGSSDFHMTAPLGSSRTYVLTADRSAAGVLDAIRHGRTVARDGRGELFGSPEHVEAVERFLSAATDPLSPTGAERLAAALALLALAALAVLR